MYVDTGITDVKKSPSGKIAVFWENRSELFTEEEFDKRFKKLEEIDPEEKAKSFFSSLECLQAYVDDIRERAEEFFGPSPYDEKDEEETEEDEYQKYMEEFENTVKDLIDSLQKKWGMS